MRPHHDRTSAGCLCCGSHELRRETTLVSGFIAERAWGGLPELTSMVFCDYCGFRCVARGLSDIEANRLYRHYRDDDYFRMRNRWEPFYTRPRHQAAINWAHSPRRAADLRQTLARADLPGHFAYAIDHGGNDGHMLTAINAAKKIVFDPSGCLPLPGIVATSDPAALSPGCDLLLSCQVLEHVTDPVAYLRQATALCVAGAYLYIEVPDESWSNHAGHGRLRDVWINFLLRWHHALRLADMLSTGCRIKFKILPPFGFVPMREHLNYFTIKALESIVLASKLELLLSGRNGEGQLFVIARNTASCHQ